MLFEKLPFFALSFASCIVTFLAQRRSGAVDASLSFGARTANASVAFAQYIAKTLWPAKLAVLYPHPGHWPTLTILLATTLLIAISAVVIVVRHRRPYLLVGWLLFMGTLVPVSGLVQVGLQSMADRYNYVPSIGLLIVLIWGLRDLLLRVRPPLWLPLSFSVAVLSALGGLTVRQLKLWKDSETLLRHAISVTENNFVAYDSLGLELASKGQVQQAILCFEQAIRMRPNYPWAHSNLGKLLLDLNRWDEAIPEYQESLRLKPADPIAHNNLGLAVAMTGQLDLAADQFHQAIACDPTYATAHMNLGKLLMQQNKLDSAIPELLEALRLNPRDPAIHNNLGVAKAMSGRVSEAVKHFTDALTLDPENASARQNLARAVGRPGPSRDGVLEPAPRLKGQNSSPDSGLSLPSPPP